MRRVRATSISAFALISCFPLLLLAESTSLDGWKAGMTVDEPLVLDSTEKRCLPERVSKLSDRPVVIFTNAKEFPEILDKQTCPQSVSVTVSERLVADVVPTFKGKEGEVTYGKPQKRQVVKLRIASITPARPRQ